jgi:hypothetical protein
MKAPSPILFAAMLTIGAALAQTPVTREGADWVQTVTGSMAIGVDNSIHIRTDGTIVVRGQNKDARVSYTLKKRVRARSAIEAASAFRNFGMRWHTGSLLELNALARRQHVAELTVLVPVTMRLVVVETRAGNVTASDLSGDLEAGTAGGVIELNRLGGWARVRTGGGEIRIGQVAGGVRCYSGGGNIQVGTVGLESWFETAGGDIGIREAGGTVYASTGGGNIRVGQSGGEVFAHTAGGIIEVQRAAGLVTAGNSGGAIEVNAAKGVRCESTAGAIRLRNVDGGSVRATTAVGSILAELLSGARLQDSLLSTSAGDITVFLSSNIAVTVQAKNQTIGGGSRIVSDFPEIRIRSSGYGAPQAFAEGTLNGGGPILQIQAAGGTIYLRRQK